MVRLLASANSVTTAYVLVGLGGALGTGIYWTAVNHPRLAPERALLVLNLAASGLLGVLTAANPGQTVVNLLGLGVLASAAPFTALGLHAGAVQGPNRVGQIAFGIASNVIAGAATALLGFLSVKFGITLYHKLV